MKKTGMAFLSAIVAGCSSPVASKNALVKTDPVQLTQFKQLVLIKAPPGTKALAVCGSSHGQAAYVDFKPKEWIVDTITTGRFAFLEMPDGSFDYVFRDATGQVLSAVADGGEVRRIYTAGNAEDSTFTVAYTDTGVVETYNITSDLEGGRLALWTSNKPVVIGPAKVSAFLSSCIG